MEPELPADLVEQLRDVVHTLIIIVGILVFIIIFVIITEIIHFIRWILKSNTLAKKVIVL